MVQAPIPEPTKALPLFLSRPQLAAALGLSLSAIDQRVHDLKNPLPVHRFGRKYFFRLEEVVAYMRAAGKRKVVVHGC